MDSNEGRDGGPKEDGKCVICGYHGLEEDTYLGEVVCPSCGCVNEERIIDTDGAELSRGEEPQNSPTRKLGSGAIKGKDRSARKLEETRKKVDRERLTFLSEVE